jgi:predicted secreted Zn-dependent protease
MNKQPRTRLGTISIWLSAVPLLALISWFVINPPCGSLLRSFIEHTVLWGTAVSVPFSIVAAFKDRPRKRALIGLSIGAVPLICFITLVVAIVYAVATGSTGIPGTMELMYSGSTSTSAMLEPGVFITTETDYYDVSGSTENELIAQTTSLGRDGFMGRTSPSFHWDYTFRAQEGLCRIDRVRVDTLITFTYPRWNNASKDQQLVEWWGRSLAALEDHEAGHEENSRKTSQEIYDTLCRLPSSQSCDELKQAINDRAQDVLEKAKKIDQEFDRVTDHGRLQTVKNP